MPNRTYSNELRAEQSAMTRRRIIAAGARLFVDRGYAATTLQAIAREAGISVQTVYNVIGGKTTLFHAVYDVTLAGDDEPIPMMARPEIRAVLQAPSGAEALRRYASVGAAIGRRVAPLVRTALAHPDLHEFVALIEGQRAIGTSTVAMSLDERDIRGDLTQQDAATLLWALTGPEIADRLVVQRGWTWERYEAWLGQAMIDAVLDRSAHR